MRAHHGRGMTNSISRSEGNAFRFGGHQSFALRIAWLPKAVAAIEAGIDPLSDPLVGVVELGLGKNMVEALRCWIDAFGVAHRARSGGWELTSEGQLIFGSGGADPFLEDHQTLWWLHWTIATRTAPRFFAWELLANRWSDPDFTPSRIVAEFLREAEMSARTLSPVSARQHFDVWLQTYLPGRTGRGEEGLDSPLASLGLIRLAGERERVDDRREPVYAFTQVPRSSLGQAMLRYALATWWQDSNADEETASLRELTYGRGSPGRVFRMEESELRERLFALSADRDSGFAISESANQLMVIRTGAFEPIAALRAAYQTEGAGAERSHVG
jgi:hypothetical protein